MHGLIKSTMLGTVGFSLMFATSTASAAERASFFEIEHVIGEDSRLEAEQALVERIAGHGVGVDQARAALERAGASFIRAGKDGRLQFIYTAPETFVTVLLRPDGGLVSSAKVSRITLGG